MKRLVLLPAFVARVFAVHAFAVPAIAVPATAVPAFAVAAALLLSACNPLLSTPGGLVDVPVIQHVASTGSFDYSVDPGAAAHDVYFVFTNASVDQNASTKPSVNGAEVTVDGVSLPAPQPQPMYSVNSFPTTLGDWIGEFNRDPFGSLGVSASASRSSYPGGAGEPSLDTVGSGGPFNDFTANNTMISVPATCRYVSLSPITIADGTTRTLNIWVADDCWSATGTVGTGLGQKRHLVDSTMVSDLAAKFLSAGSNNDIYDWDTAVVGAEWGPHSFTNLIAPNGEITILLSDIEGDNSDNGGVVGYFWSGNNFKTSTEPDSNQRIMFVLDAVMYANPSPTGATGVGGSGWDPSFYWPKLVFSTLAHEFQHMIHFYQKQILKNVQAGTDTWINEMCSMIMEDLVSDKLGVEGPRGVNPADGSAGSPGINKGRIPDFNQYSYYPLAQKAGYGLVDYSVSYAFGSWLARNYGGAALLNRIVQCPQTDESAVVNAVAAFTGRTDETFARLLERWSAAVLLSDVTQAPAGYRYNTGGWTAASQGGISYNLGSINIFNYVPALTVFNGSGSVPSSVFYRSSNVYYLAARSLGSSRTWKIKVPTDVLMSVVIN